MKPPFTVDHAEILTRHILAINRHRLEQLDNVAQRDGVERGSTSILMQAVEREWADEIRRVCHETLAHMSDSVAEYQRIATEALARIPRKAEETARAQGYDPNDDYRKC